LQPHRRSSVSGLLSKIAKQKLTVPSPPAYYARAITMHGVGGIAVQCEISSCTISAVRKKSVVIDLTPCTVLNMRIWCKRKSSGATRAHALPRTTRRQSQSVIHCACALLVKCKGHGPPQAKYASWHTTVPPPTTKKGMAKKVIARVYGAPCDWDSGSGQCTHAPATHPIPGRCCGSNPAIPF